MDNTFYDGHDELYHHAKFGEDRTTCAGCRSENVVCFFGHAPSPLLTYLTCVRRVHSSNKHCVAVYCPISIRFAAFFSEVIPLSEALHSSHIRR